MTIRSHHHRVWLFDLDDTLHHAAEASMREIRDAMGAYIREHLQLGDDEAAALRRRYWLRYGATLLGLVRHDGIKAAHFLHETHRLPGLEDRIRGHRHDLAALARLPGRRVLLTNAPAAYAARVLAALGAAHLFERIVSIEDMVMFGQLRPKPDARMLRAVAVRLRVRPAQCVLVEDTLVHQKAARRVGMGTAWMQRWLQASLRAGGGGDRPDIAQLQRRPAYVDRRVRRLRDLLRR